MYMGELKKITRKKGRISMRMKRYFAAMLAVIIVLSMFNIGRKANSQVIKAKERTEDFVVMSTGDIDLEYMTKEFNDSEQTVNNDNLVVCEMTESDAERLRKKDDGIIVEKDIEIFASSKAVNKHRRVRTEKEWNMKAIHAEKTNQKDTGENIKIAVIDSGVDDYNDIVLAGSVNFLPGEENVSPLYVDVTGHGSSVAGIIGAQDNGEGITGIVPEAELYSAKVFDKENCSTISRVIDAIYWAIEQKVNIINMSFGTVQDSPALHRAIQDAEKSGILLIAAAGNGELVEYPAAYKEVMAVGSVNADGEISDCSAGGDEIEIVAPGEQICSTGAFGGVVITAGTSMSAPHITGVAAKLWGKDKSVSAEFIRQLINVSANQFTKTSECGNGLVDYSYAEKIYDEFKSTYDEGETLNKNQSDIEPNEKDILSFGEVDYVEGRWSGDAHKAGIVNSSLTKAEINVIKQGTIYPDQCSAMVKLSKHPYWHGGYKCSNYISSYIYVTNMALALKSGKNAYAAAKPAGLSDEDKSSMANAVNGLKWSGILTSPTKKNKCLFIWGMAIHNAMDVYSHSAWGRINGVWQHLDHPRPINDNPKNGLADRTDANAFPERYSTAVKVAKKSLSTYVSGKAGNVYDFVPANAYKGAGTNWTINKLERNANVLSNLAANSLKAYSCNRG